MPPSERRDIPDFLANQIVCFCKIQRKHKRSHLALLKTLKLVEFQRKKLITCLELQTTCLSKVIERIKDYNPPASEISVENADGGDVGSPEKTLELTPKLDVYFGKFINRNLDVYHFFLLLQCWDKLVVLRQSGSESDYHFHAEYEGVTDFKLVHGTIKFEVFVQINFENGRSMRTNFHEEPKDDVETARQPKGAEFKQLLERVRISKTQLHIHKAVTQKSFERFRDRQVFGCNFIRSLNLDEKQIVSRYGDCWMRFTTDDTLVMGFPLVNNCSASSLMVLHNVQPLLKPKGDAMKGIKYDYRLFHLQQQFEDLESVETYFQSEDEDLQSSFWMPNNGQQLLPESFAVLLVKLNIQDLIAVKECPIFLHFELKKDLCLSTDDKETKTETYEQQVLLKNVNFHQILRKRQMLEVNFATRTFHQDFLTMAFSSVEISLAIEFKTLDDLNVFENSLIKKFDFIHIKRQGNGNPNLAMEIDDNEEIEAKPAADRFHTLYYNPQPNSMWYGLMVWQESTHSNRTTTLWKFYTKTKSKAYLLIKLLLDDMLESKCNINRLEYPVHKKPIVQIAEFECALRQEMMSLLAFVKSNLKGITYDDIIKLLKLQAQTDVIASNLNIIS